MYLVCKSVVLLYWYKHVSIHVCANKEIIIAKILVYGSVISCRLSMLQSQ